MNKYFKILMLSGGLVGAIATTAIDTNKNENNDLSTIYEQVEKIQNIVPKLSRINYKLNISLDDTTASEDANAADEIAANDSVENNIDTNNVNNDSSIESQDTTGNISFTTTDENGNETNLTNQETLNYLNETLIQTNIEYEQLKEVLTEAIKDAMDYLESYKNGETTLTNEQKIYIKEHANSIKFLAETLEDLSEDVICCIDGCNSCNDQDFEQSASTYITSITELEKRIQTMHDIITSLQFINNISSPYFYAGQRNNPYMFYGFHYNNVNSNEDNNNQQTGTETNENEISSSEQNNAIEVENNEEANVDSVNNTQNDSSEKTNTDSSVENNDEKPTTFGLKSNIDTYAPTRRNIDTFFNTALQNNEFMYGNGYGMPYSYGGGFGYGMPYGGGYYGNPYGNNLNSNLVNRAELEKQQNESSVPSTNTVASIDSETEETTKPNKIRVKRAKNIDTYTGTTVQSNINSMGESKISKFFKEKFNNLRNKVRNKTNNEDLKDNSNNVPNVDENNINDITDEINNTIVDTTNTENEIINNVNDLNIDDENNHNNTSSETSSPIPRQEEDIKAR